MMDRKDGELNQVSRIANRTSPATRATEPGAVIRYDGDELQMVNLCWGLRPSEDGGRPFTTVRAEGRSFPSHRCSLPASEFYIDHKKTRYRFTLAETELFFFAGIWRPASRGWPASYAVITTPAGPDLEAFQSQQMAVILDRDRFAWLHHEGRRRIC